MSSPLTFSCERRVTYADCAPGNHVYYSRYLEFLEEARGEMFRYLGSSFLSWQQQNTVFPAIECILRYKSPARYDDLLTIQVWLCELERVRFRFAYRIVNSAGQDILHASSLHACASADEKLKRIPDTLKAALTPYLHVTVPWIEKS